ncbi:hypothetical protein [Streptomyces sp. NBC_00304]|uniref:hypothetical protein n=1 Tax=Streptomyces sp. NBC_00304 TaxID=2975706 RepID=UPI002E2E1EBE|nr:hypothetical protein [Streptomyces sp. NBC_00304]
MSGVPYAAEITATTGGRPVSLGRAILPNRRLALRWLRRQARRLADGLGAPEPEPSISFRSPAVPDGLRAWAEAPDQQEHAMARLAAGGPDLLTVLDPAAGLLVTLAGWPVRQRRAAAGYSAPEPPPHPYPRIARAGPHVPSTGGRTVIHCNSRVCPPWFETAQAHQQAGSPGLPHSLVWPTVATAAREALAKSRSPIPAEMLPD